MGKEWTNLKSGRKILFIFFAALMILGAALCVTVYGLYKAENNYIMGLKDSLKIYLSNIKLPAAGDEYADLEGGYTETEHNGSKVITSGDTARLVSYNKGYRVDLPEDTEFDFSLAPLFIKAGNGEYSVTISREYATEDGVSDYTAHYLDRFFMEPAYREQNNMELLYYNYETAGEGEPRIFTLRIKDMEGGFDTYSYLTVFTGTRLYYRLVFKYDYENHAEISGAVSRALESFKYFKAKGSAEYDTDFYPAAAEKLTGEAGEVYARIKSAESPCWGVYTPGILARGSAALAELEAELEYDFPVALAYVHLGQEFPSAFMEDMYSGGKLVELTYQITRNNNYWLYGYSPQLAIYKGELDDELREFARAAAVFGHPFIFRLNNEMNSDWTSYSGVVNLCDPEIYVAVWQRIFRIFEEEGATNAIWVYNPNDKAFPPCDWNSFLAYYPGNDFVHMIGLTGYNTGTYYGETQNEKWRSFSAIYDAINGAYMPFFDEFPWMITEFASSSVGGDKAKWIKDMFRDMKNYPNIKIAVWFDAADYDPAYEKDTIVSRPYWIAETEETLNAMKSGLKSAGREGLLH